ncbi:MAG: YciI family protein [Saccharospirillum sp.]|uniref:YciI family protein n=1 Tax=Saccharospirillum sp. TaxID=2033801 RepID=UPI0032988F57
MWFSIVCEDVPDSLSRRQSVRADHLKRLETLKDEGRLLIAGPNPAVEANDPGEAGFTGSLIIAEFESLADARAWAEADPYIDAGVYAEVSIKPFKKVLP